MYHPTRGGVRGGRDRKFLLFLVSRHIQFLVVLDFPSNNKLFRTLSLSLSLSLSLVLFSLLGIRLFCESVKLRFSISSTSWQFHQFLRQFGVMDGFCKLGFPLFFRFLPFLLFVPFF